MKRSTLGIATLAAAAVTACGPVPPDTLYTKLGCPRCHGRTREGNRYGPALSDLGTLWESNEALVTYMRDPKSYVAGHPRLEKQGKEYDLMMLPVRDASDEELATLAQWLRDKD